MRVEPRAAGAVLTAMLHVLALAVFAQVTLRVINLPPAETETSADALHGAGEKVVEVDINPGLSSSGLACEGSSYIGVGITAEPSTERIILVGDSTPASRAGLQHDDIVLNPGVWRDAHKEGAWLHLRVLRAGVQIEVAVLVGKICIG